MRAHGVAPDLQELSIWTTTEGGRGAGCGEEQPFAQKREAHRLPAREQSAFKCHEAMCGGTAVTQNTAQAQARTFWHLLTPLSKKMPPLPGLVAGHTLAQVNRWSSANTATCQHAGFLRCSLRTRGQDSSLFRPQDHDLSHALTPQPSVRPSHPRGLAPSPTKGQNQPQAEVRSQ